MSQVRPLLISFGTLAAATGILYPALLTGIAQVVFPRQAGGSLIRVDGQIRGSMLLGQATQDARYFWGRPSQTAAFPTNASASGGSTLAASNPAFAEAVAKRIEVLRSSDPAQTAPIPQDLITASASGLDPHISLEAALWQAPRIARARNLPVAVVLSLVASKSHRLPTGGAVVVVLALNLDLDALPRA